MRADLFQMAADLANQGEPFAMAFVVRRLPASSAREGDMALVRADGAFLGWLGGSCTQPTVVREAKRALADGWPRLLALSPDPESERRPGVVVSPMTCHSGGSVEIYIEPVLPAPRLVLFGGSPVVAALTQLGQAMGYSVTAGEAQSSGAQPTGHGQVFALVATMGESDEDAIRAALAAKPVYLGVVASARRFEQIRETLLARGLTREEIDTFRCPAGLRIGARSPEEIAVSILAEIVERRRSLAAAAEAAPEPVSTPASAMEAIDPVCGMTVDPAKAKHSAEHAGRVYYFCCGGCRERFQAAPERYLMPGIPA